MQATVPPAFLLRRPGYSDAATRRLQMLNAQHKEQLRRLEEKRPNQQRAQYSHIRREQSQVELLLDASSKYKPQAPPGMGPLNLANREGKSAARNRRDKNQHQMQSTVPVTEPQSNDDVSGMNSIRKDGIDFLKNVHVSDDGKVRDIFGPVCFHVDRDRVGLTKVHSRVATACS